MYTYIYIDICVCVYIYIYSRGYSQGYSQVRMIVDPKILSQCARVDKGSAGLADVRAP